jgi:hypothetical protein
VGQNASCVTVLRGHGRSVAAPAVVEVRAGEGGRDDEIREDVELVVAGPHLGGEGQAEQEGERGGDAGAAQGAGRIEEAPHRFEVAPHRFEVAPKPFEVAPKPFEVAPKPFEVAPKPSRDAVGAPRWSGRGNWYDSKGQQVQVSGWGTIVKAQTQTLFRGMGRSW